MAPLLIGAGALLALTGCSLGSQHPSGATKNGSVATDHSLDDYSEVRIPISGQRTVTCIRAQMSGSTTISLSCDWDHLTQSASTPGARP